MRKSGIASLLLVTSLGAGALLIGCDKDAVKPGDKVVNQSEKTTSDSNGNKSTSEQKTVKHSDGTVTQEKHSDSTNNNP